jgi:glucose-6-phosphate 1-dehydrogenase
MATLHSDAFVFFGATGDLANYDLSALLGATKAGRAE